MSSTSTSDHDISEYSNSPSSYTMVLSPPYGSPSHQMPQLSTDLSELSCVDKCINNFLLRGAKPELRIIEQPQNHFRFRYVSEMVGTHGCLLGKSYAHNKTKTHPTVELLNYTGQAIIRCNLVQHNNTADHPHRLLEDDQDRDVSSIVPENGSYKVGFAGIGIIHTAKKDVSGLLYKKFSEQLKHTKFNTKELKVQCDNLAKNINLNIVRLKFSAHDETGKEICEPVYSESIHNMKSAATNDLKICRISLCSGRPRGGDDVFIFVEKVNRKNIVIRFRELDQNGEEVWTDTGKFLQTDVHHQYGIVFRTPPYKNPESPVNVNVLIDLVRPSDGRTSEPIEFTYKAESVYKQNKKRKNNSYSSADSFSSGSLNNLITTTNEYSNQNTIKREPEGPVMNMAQSPLQAASPPRECGLANALSSMGAGTGGIGGFDSIHTTVTNPATMWAQRPLDPFPNLRINSTELEEIISKDVGPQDIEMSGEDWMKYVSSFTSLSEIQTEEVQVQDNPMGFIRSTLVADSGRVKVEPSTSKSPVTLKFSTPQDNTTNEYSAVYKLEDGLEVKKLVQELCDIIRNKKSNQDIKELRTKLERLFDIRLSNGDTFLHMTLYNNQPSFESIVKIIHTVKMTHLLNLTNNNEQTILHLAVVSGSPKLISFLICKGCNPMIKDSDEDNAVHYAVKYNRSCLETLLEAIKKNNVPFDYNDCNSEKQTALHLAALVGCGESTRVLLSAGWSPTARDAMGRAPLHLAALDGKLEVMKELLKVMPSNEIDMTDGCGNTALQIVCGTSYSQNCVAMAQLLLEHKADPSKHEDHNESAWKLSRNNPEIREAMQRYECTAAAMEDDVKSEPEDEFESADEEVLSCGLEGLSQWGEAVASCVESSGKWRALASALGASALAEWLAQQPRPALALLMHVKECGDDISSKSLAVTLEDMGLLDSANIIRSFIDKE